MKTKLLFTFSLLLSIVTNAQTAYQIKTKDNGESLSFQATKPIVINDKMYFSANTDESISNSLVSYDGTNRPNLLLPVDALNRTEFNNITDLNLFNNKIYFVGKSIINDLGVELYSYDLATGYTINESNLRSGSASSNPNNFFVFDNRLYFTATSNLGTELHGINTSGSIISFAGIEKANYFTPYNNKLYFFAEKNGNDGLYVYDGVNSPSLVADINTVGQSFISYITEFNGSLYFAGQGDTGGSELWKFDEVNGASLVADLNDNGASQPQNLIVFNNKLHFTIDDGINGRELWEYDGIKPPFIVTDINSFGDAFTSATSGSPLDFIILEDILYFSADNGSDGFELFEYDGINTPRLVSDINSGLMSSNPTGFTIFNDALYFKGQVFGQNNLYKYHPNETVPLINNPSWTSSVDWSNGLPHRSTKELYIPENIDISLTQNGSAKKITLEDGAKLTITKGYSLSIKDDVNIATNASLEIESDNDESGTLLFNGDSNGVVTFKRTEIVADEWHLFSSPFTELSLQSFVEHSENEVKLNTAEDKYAIATYNDANGAGSKWEYFDKTTIDNGMAGNFIPAKGYTMSFSGGGPSYYFVGELNNNFRTDLPINEGKWNLVGNPYLGFYGANYYDENNLDRSSAITDNYDNIDDSYKALYFWSTSQNKYVAVSGSPGGNTRFIQPGQAFFIKAREGILDGLTTFTFFKENSTSQPPLNENIYETSFNKRQTTDVLNLSISNTKVTVNTTIQFDDSATDGLDIGLDIGNFDGSELDIYTKLVDNSISDINYTKQAIANTVNTIIPLGVTAKANENLTLKIVKENTDNNNFYLVDSLKNKEIKITEEGLEYLFTTEENLRGTGRFSVKINSKTLSTEDINTENIVLSSINNQIQIKNIPEEINTIAIYDTQGKLIQSKSSTKNTLDINMVSHSKGLYIVSFNGKGIKKSKKILLK